MSRRQIRSYADVVPEERETLGKRTMEEAVNKLNRLAQNTASTMTEYNTSREATIAMLFADEDINKSRAVRDIVKPDYLQKTYTVAPNVTLSIDYNDAMTVPIMPERLAINPQRIGPLHKVLAEIRVIHEQYEEVKALLRWFNRTATPGAIRFYWPSILKICGNAPAFVDLQGVPSRYQEPPGISDRLQMIRDTATIIAASAMLPSMARPRQRSHLWITFGSYTYTRPDDFAGAVVFLTDSAVYNL